MAQKDKKKLSFFAFVLHRFHFLSTWHLDIYTRTSHHYSAIILFLLTIKCRLCKTLNAMYMWFIPFSRCSVKYKLSSLQTLQHHFIVYCYHMFFFFVWNYCSLNDVCIYFFFILLASMAFPVYLMINEYDFVRPFKHIISKIYITLIKLIKRNWRISISSYLYFVTSMFH